MNKNLLFSILSILIVVLTAYAAHADIVINEIMPNPDQDYNGDSAASFLEDEYVELYNTGITPVNISGWTLYDEASPSRVYTFPSGTVLLSHQYLTVFRSDGGPILNTLLDILNLNNSLTVVDSYVYADADNRSIGRIKDGDPNITILKLATPNTSNNLRPEIDFTGNLTGAPDVKYTHYNLNNPALLVPGGIALHLRSYAKDREVGSEGLNYTILSQTNTSIVNCSINAPWLNCTYSPNSFGITNITVQVTDDAFQVANDTIMFNVSFINQTPQTNRLMEFNESGERLDGAFGVKNVTRGETITIWIEAFDEDDILDALRYEYSLRTSGNTSWNIINSIEANEICNTGSCLPGFNAKYLRYTVPVDAPLGSYDVRGRVIDSEGHNSSKINNNEFVVLNNAPVLFLEDLYLTEDTPFEINFTEFADDDESIQLLDFAWITNSNLNISYNNTIKVWTISPSRDFNGDTEFSLGVSDNDGGSRNYTIRVHVAPVNDRPEIFGISDFIADEDDVDEYLYLDAHVYDPDNNPEEMTWQVSTNDSHLHAVINETRVFRVTADENWFGEGLIRLNVSDGELNNQFDAYVFIASINDAPTLVEIPTLYAVEGLSFSYDINATDIDSPQKNLSYELLSTSSGYLNLNRSSGIFTWIPNQADADLQYANFEVTVTDNDPYPGYDTNNFDIVVTPALDPINIKVKVDGIVFDNYQEGHVINAIKPLSNVSIEVTVKNKLVHSIEDIRVNARSTGLSVDNPLLFDALSRINLASGQEKTGKTSFEVPTPITEGLYNVLVSGSGKEVFGPGLSEERHFGRTITLNLTKEFHNIIISNVSLEQNKFQCIRDGRVDIKVKNLGFLLEDDANLTLSHPSKGVFQYEGFDINPNQEKTLTEPLFLREFAPGNYTVQATVDYNNNAHSTATTFDVEVLECNLPTVTVDEDSGVFGVDLWLYTTGDYNGTQLSYDIIDITDPSLLHCGITSGAGYYRYLNCSVTPDRYGEADVMLNITKGDFSTEVPVHVVVNNINDAPFFIGPEVDAISPIIIQEEGYNDEVNLSALVDDIDNTLSELNFVISTSSNLSALVYGTAGNRQLNITAPIADFIGDEIINFTVMDPSGAKDSVLVPVHVDNTADAPSIIVQDGIVESGNELNITLYGHDPDGQVLTFDSNFTRPSAWIDQISDQTAVFHWFPEDADIGTHKINFSVEDPDNQFGYAIASIVVLNKNEGPTLFEVVPDVDPAEVDQDATVYFTLKAYDPDIKYGDLLTFSVNDSHVVINNITYNQTNNTATARAAYTPNASVVGTFGSIGIELLFKVNDSFGLQLTEVGYVEVFNVNDAPVIKTFSPANPNPIITEDGFMVFKVNATDIDGDILEYTWFVDGMEVTGSNPQATVSVDKKSLIFSGDGSSATYHIESVITDGEFEIAKSWSLKTTNSPIATQYVLSYNGPVNNASHLIIRKPGFGRIEFPSHLAFDLSNIGDVDAITNISKGIAALDTAGWLSPIGHPLFDTASATITLEGLAFGNTPTLYYNSGFGIISGQNTCPATLCKNISYSGGILNFEVAHFTSYFVQSATTIAACSDGIDNDGDGLVDYPADPGCSSASDNDEANSGSTPQCSDGIDNDGDGLTDYPADPGCSSTSDNSESNTGSSTACNDGIDNDGDTLIDYPLDPGCTSTSDDDESNSITLSVNQVFLGGPAFDASNPNRDVEKNDTKSLTFVNTKQNPVSITGWNITVVGVGLNQNDIKLAIKSITNSVLNPGESTTVTVEGRISEKIPAVNENNEAAPLLVATVVLSGTLNGNSSANVGTFDVFMQRKNKLILDKVEASYADKSEKIKNSDKLDKLKPGDDITFDAKVKNQYSKNDKVSIEEVLLKIVLQNDNDESNVDLNDDEQDMGTIDENDDKNDQLTIKLENDADDGAIPIFLSVEGVDEYGAKHGERFDIDLEVEREDDEVIIERAEVSPDSLSCTLRTVFVSVELFNSGKRDQDDVGVIVDAPTLDYTERVDSISLDSDDSSSKTFGIVPSSSIRPGSYPIEVKVTIDGDQTDVQTLYLTVGNCGGSVDNSQVPVDDGSSSITDQVILQTGPATAPVFAQDIGRTQTSSTSITSGIADNELYLTLLIVLFVILAGLIVFVLGASVIGLKRRQRRQRKQRVYKNY